MAAGDAIAGWRRRGRGERQGRDRTVRYTGYPSFVSFSLVYCPLSVKPDMTGPDENM